MKYYDETRMRVTRTSLEKEVLGWPGVTTKKMYGCPCYKYQKKLFAFLVTDGVVLTKTNKNLDDELSNRFATKPFQAGSRTMKGWPQLSVELNTDLNEIIAFIRKSYDLAKIEL